MDVEYLRFGLSEANAAKIRSGQYARHDGRLAPLAHHRLGRVEAPEAEVLGNPKWRAFHAMRFWDGADDGLAITAWCDYMDERQFRIRNGSFAIREEAI